MKYFFAMMAAASFSVLCLLILQRPYEPVQRASVMDVPLADRWDQINETHEIPRSPKTQQFEIYLAFADWRLQRLSENYRKIHWAFLWFAGINTITFALLTRSAFRSPSASSRTRSSLVGQFELFLAPSVSYETGG
ncbi:hypothetical protein [Sulfuriroseicoccus oceanibius]|uniref:Uncharacterized protein n=1 Tax=Sulfuriroseicoccus oceanibius TaxID=2707525 RepID=A0A6B3L9A8_9BACT|nr:hypothetical protein [Sulfuriroseicoccus oceanibius]QQL45178.1 hypothetical protein G3M56_000905 [Sulfuriroseicoccus oceanibius]